MAILAIDSFQRANENPLSNGGNWTTVTGESALQIVSNVCEGSSTSARNSSFFSGVVWPNDQYSEMKLTSAASGTLGPLVRVASAAETYYFAALSNGDTSNSFVTIYQVVAGSFNSLGSSSGFTTAAGGVLREQAQGTTISALYNGISVLSVTDSTITAGSTGIQTDANPLSNVQISAWDGGNFLPASATHTISSTAETVIIDGAPGLNNMLTGLIITVSGSSPAAGTLTIRDSVGGTVRMVIDYPNSTTLPGTPFVTGKDFPGLFQSAPGQSWTIQASNVTTQTYHVTAFYREA